MGMDIKAISSNVGKALLVNALFMMLSIIVSISDGLDEAFTPLVISFLITSIMGAFPLIFVRNSHDYSIIDGYVTIVITWLMSFIVGMLPYVLYGGEFTLINAWFESVSGYTTTGFGNADNALWPVLANMFLLFAAFHCGCSGSTTGGIKADRMLIMIRSIRNEFKHRLHPSSVFCTKVDGHTVNNTQIYAVFLYFVAYVLILFIALLAVLVSGVEISDAFSGTLASLGNVGPGLGSLGTMGNYA